MRENVNYIYTGYTTSDDTIYETRRLLSLKLV